MFSQTVEYALRAVVFLAQQGENAQTTEQIAKATQVPQAYLAKVLQSLLRSGISKSQRGIKGGIRLSRDPQEITIYQVIQAVDPIQRINTCPLKLAAHGTQLCPLHKRIDDALASVEAAFRATTLAEVVNEPTQSIPLCNFPCVPDAKTRAPETV
jgi:Rrf2 family transcriptional regulator, nitric oxide-sensitive transcriptional repressor